MRRALRPTIFLLLLPTILYGQESSADWIEALGDPGVTERVARIEDEESRLPPLSSLSQGWFDAVESVGELLLRAGVHRSSSRYEEAASYLYERAAWAGMPPHRLREARTRSEELLGSVDGGPEERALVAELLGTLPESVEAGDAGESSALDALRRLELELLTSSSLSRKVELSRRAREGMTLLFEIREEIPKERNWDTLERLFREAAGAVEVFRTAEAAAPTISETSELTIGASQEELLQTLGPLDPGAVEMALRWEPRVALGAATFFDAYRWSLAPPRAVARLGALVLLIEKKESELYRELFRRRVEEQSRELRIREEWTGSEELREQLLGEARSVLRRYEERAKKGEDEAERWALLSVLSHPYAQLLLFQEGEERLQAQLRGRVETLYGEVDERARELLALVARRHGVAEWSYEVTPLPDSFDRIVTIQLLPEEEAEVDRALEEQLSEAYYRAFNLVTNPEQNEELVGHGLAAWSMLHGQYFEPVIRSDERAPRFSERLRPWFLQEERSEEPRGSFPFVYRGYQRLSFAQSEWLRRSEKGRPGRWHPKVPVELHLVNEEVARFLNGERNLFELRETLDSLMDSSLRRSHVVWASALEELEGRYVTESRGKLTTELLEELRSEPGRTERLVPSLEARLRRIRFLRELELIDPEVGEEAVYDAWIESAVPALLATAPIDEALQLPRRWRETRLLGSSGAQRFYRELSSEGVEALLREGEENE